MQYYDFLVRLPAQALVKEKDSETQEFSRTGGDLDRMKLALLLWLPDTPFRNGKAALDLLDKTPGDKNLASFAAFFKVMLAAQQDAENAQSRLEQTLEKERKHAAALQDKIDAIKKMEKTLLDHKVKP